MRMSWALVSFTGAFTTVTQEVIVSCLLEVLDQLGLFTTCAMALLPLVGPLDGVKPHDEFLLGGEADMVGTCKVCPEPRITCAGIEGGTVLRDSQCNIRAGKGRGTVQDPRTADADDENTGGKAPDPGPEKVRGRPGTVEIVRAG